MLLRTINLFNWFTIIFIAIVIIRIIDKKIFNSAISFNFKYFLFFTLVSIMSIFCIPLFFIFDRGDCVNSQRISVVLRKFSYILGVRWEVRGIDILRDPQGCVVVANHQNAFDVLGMFWIWRYFRRMAAVAKKEIFYVWPFGLSAYLAGVVFIDRKDSCKAKKELKESSRMMNEDGTKLFIFPEGTRNPKRFVAPFKKGAFHLAVECGVPVLPLVISPYFFINPAKKFFGSGRVIIEALPLVSTEGLSTFSDVANLTEKVHSLISERYRELSDELRATIPPDYPGL